MKVHCYGLHRKILLTKGLRFLIEVFHLFPPIDKVTAEAKAHTLHREALSVSHFILEQLLAQTIPEGEQSSPERIADSEAEANELSELQILELESDYIPSVTDDEREADKRSRLQVLLKLLDLACVMVRDRRCILVRVDSLSVN